MVETDYLYYRRRAAEERKAAELSLHPLARQVHSDIAERYEEIAEASTATILQGKFAVGA